MENRTAGTRYGTIWKRLNTFKKKTSVSQKKKKKVNGRGQLPQTIFADDGNRSSCGSSWRFSVCERKIAHLTDSTAKEWLT